jgi:hypothetical protein
VAGRNAHVVLLGDFNDTPDSSSVRFWTGRQSLEGLSVAYQDAWEPKGSADAGHTFSPSNPLVRAGEMPLELGRRIDYIMIRSGIHGPTLAISDSGASSTRVLTEFGQAIISGLWLICRSPRIRPGSGRTSSFLDGPSAKTRHRVRGTGPTALACSMCSAKPARCCNQDHVNAPSRSLRTA